jgi:glycosyltransferase involved in cell wall biosynthesis
MISALQTGRHVYATSDSRRHRVAYNAISNALTVRGPERYHLGLLPALAALRPPYDLVVVHAPWQDYYAPFASVAGLKREVVAAPHSRIARGLWQLANGGVRGGSYDLVHLGNVLPVPLGLKVPMTAMVHDSLEFRTPAAYGKVRRWARRKLVAELARQARVIVTVNTGTARDLQTLFNLGPERAVAIGTGVDAATVLKPQPWEQRKAALAFVGGLDPHKRLDLVLRSLVELPNVRLRIVSAGGSAERDLRSLAIQLGIHGRVDWLGRLDDDAARRVVAESAALVMASDLEGFGLPILEALQVGTPVVISSTLPFADEWRAHGGPVFPAGDAKGLSEAVRGLLADSDRAAHLVALGPVLAAGYGWEKVAVRLDAIFRCVLGVET